MSQQNTNLTGNGQTTAITVADGGRVLMIVDGGTWGSGTLALQAQDPADAWKDIAAGLTADGQSEVILPKGESIDIRANLTGATSPDLDIWIITEE